LRSSGAEPGYKFLAGRIILPCKLTPPAQTGIVPIIVANRHPQEKQRFYMYSKPIPRTRSNFRPKFPARSTAGIYVSISQLAENEKWMNSHNLEKTTTFSLMNSSLSPLHPSVSTKPLPSLPMKQSKKSNL
jgi:hypothetical protein